MISQQSAVAQERAENTQAIGCHLPRTLASIAGEYACTRPISGKQFGEICTKYVIGIVSDAAQEHLICLLEDNDYGAANRYQLFITDGIHGSGNSYTVSVYEIATEIKTADRGLIPRHHQVISKDTAQFDCKQKPPSKMAVTFGVCSDADGNHYVYRYSDGSGKILVFDNGTRALNRRLGGEGDDGVWHGVYDMVFDRRADRLIVLASFGDQVLWMKRDGQVTYRNSTIRNATSLALHGPYLYAVGGGEGELRVSVLDRVAGVVLSELQMHSPENTFTRKTVAVVDDKLCAVFDDSRRVVAIW